MVVRKKLIFTVAVSTHDTLSIPVEDIERLIKENNLEIDLENLTEENIETIYVYFKRNWVNAKDYSIRQDYIETTVFDDFEIEEVPVL